MIYLFLFIIIAIAIKIIFSKKCPYCECKYCRKTPDYYSCNVNPPMEIAHKKFMNHKYGNACYKCFFFNKEIKSTLK